MHLGFLDARPFLQEKVYELMQNQRYDKLVVVPLLLAESTHTQEIEEIVLEWVAKSGREIEIAWGGQPYFATPTSGT